MEIKETQVYPEFETVRFIILDQKREIESLRYKLNMALDDLRFSELQREEYNHRLIMAGEHIQDLQSKLDAFMTAKE